MQALMQFMAWLEHTEVAQFVAQSGWGFPALEMVHIAAISILVGMIAILDLRLLGLASNKCRVSDLYREVVPITWAAFAIAVPTGVLMFTGQAVKYTDNDALRLKIALLALAGVNMLAFRLFVFRGVAAWDEGAKIPAAARLAGAVSLTSWIAIVAAARWIAYLML